jgi:Rad3-related DNA helicase
MLYDRLGELRVQVNIYRGINAIWIRPYIYPLVSFNHYADSTQRLYVSATVGEPSDLSRRLGVKAITKIPVAAEHAEKTSGRRLIVMNRIEDEDIPPRLAGAILTALKIHPKSVWLCASAIEAGKYRNAVTEWLNKNGFVGHPTWQLSALGDEIDSFKSAEQGHLFVAGRFDGMDFKADECRLVVVTTLPRAINLQEEFISAYLRDASFMKRRTNQRIVQALGRCNRAEDDFGVYVLADKRFATHFGLESSREGIPSNMIAEIDMAQDNAEMDDMLLRKKVHSFLTQDFKSYDKDLAAYRKVLPPQKNEPNPVNAPEGLRLRSPDGRR